MEKSSTSLKPDRLPASDDAALYELPGGLRPSVTAEPEGERVGVNGPMVVIPPPIQVPPVVQSFKANSKATDLRRWNEKSVPPVADGIGSGMPPVFPLKDAPAFVTPYEVGSEVGEQTVDWTQRVPAWLASLIVHVVMILIFALIPFVHEIGGPFVITVLNGEEGTMQDFEISAPNEGVPQEEPVGLSVQEAALTETTVSIVETLIGTGPSKQLESLASIPALETSLNGRSGALKESLLAAYGGTKGTENAVAAGLDWLSKQQRPDGSWSLRGPYSSGGLSENKPAATAMALIAFAGAGFHHQDGQYKKVVDKGLRFLIKQQDADGCFAANTPDRQMMYAQGQATIAICELYGMTKDPTLRNPAQHAVDFAEAAQSPQGGWRYIPREDSDTSVTGWFVMALMSAKMAGLSTSRKTLDRVGDFLDSVRHDSGAQYGYVNSSPPFPSMSAEGLLCREYLGWERNHEPLIRGCERLAREPISTDAENRSYYYWYYATQTLHHFGGTPWKTWNDVMVRELPKLQVKDLKERGSWPPQHDPYGSAGGRLYSTCFAIYCLEVYYRHLPLYSLKR